MNADEVRFLGTILVHHLGASKRWRHGFQQTGESPEPEREPLPTMDELRERWDALDLINYVEEQAERG